MQQAEQQWQQAIGKLQHRRIAALMLCSGPRCDLAGNSFCGACFASVLYALLTATALNTHDSRLTLPRLMQQQQIDIAAAAKLGHGGHDVLGRKFVNEYPDGDVDDEDPMGQMEEDAIIGMTQLISGR